MISTHVLDTSNGSPAANIKVQLQIMSQNTWIDLETKTTNADGRINFEKASNPGTYQLIFSTGDYFANIPTFYQDIPVVFHITDTKRKYHVPLLLNPFGYSTYRGS